MEQKISKVSKYIGILIAMVVVSYLLSLVLFNIVDSFLWNYWQCSLVDDGAGIIFIKCTTGAMILLEIIGLILYKRNKNIFNE